jgi:hypothetical protein
MLTRRSFVELGLFGALAAGLGVRRARGQGAPTPRAQACILLYMEGGPSHIDTWDPKPGSAGAGEFKPIGTAVAGLQISEHLPLLAARMRQLALLRSLTSKEGNHQRARYLMHTGYVPAGGVDHPALGAMVADERRGGELPGYVAIGGPGEDAGFLGAALAPFPVRDPTRPVRYLSRPNGVDEARFDRRVELWRRLEDGFAARGGELAGARRAVGEQAVALVKSPSAAAFSLDGEPEPLRAAYGPTPFGQGCLMARRLVEAGVPFVEVTLRGWDTHSDNFPTVKRLSAELDQGMSALLDDLEARGRLASTLVVWLGDFGRTPRINANGGRDHHPRASSVILAGAGLKTGLVLGATDRDGAEVVERPVTVPDLYRTIAKLLGLDPDRSRTSPQGRPLKTVDGGAVIGELL